MGVKDYDKDNSASGDNRSFAALKQRFDQLAEHTNFGKFDANIAALLGEPAGISAEQAISLLANLARDYHIDLNWLLTGEK